MSNSRIGLIDAVKGFAMLMVLMVHTAQIMYCPFPHIAKFGRMGCQIFFILSAYMLCCTYLRKKPSYKSFIKHRFARLASGYWVAITLYIFLVGLSFLVLDYNYFKKVYITPPNIIINALLLNGLTPTNANNNLVLGGWFVGTLFLFYIIFPLLFRLYFKTDNKFWVKYRPVLMPICIQLVSLIILYILSVGTILPNRFLYFSLINQLPCITLGFSLYDLWVNYMCNKQVISILAWGGVGLAFLYFSFKLFFSDIENIFSLIPLVFGCGVVCLLYCLIQVIAITNIKIYIFKPFEIIGLNSFGIYLLHPIITYYLIPLIYPFTDRCISFFIQTTAIVCSINFFLNLGLVLIISSVLTIFFNKIQNRLYLWMDNVLKN